MKGVHVFCLAKDFAFPSDSCLECKDLWASSDTKVMLLIPVCAFHPMPYIFSEKCCMPVRFGKCTSLGRGSYGQDLHLQLLPELVVGVLVPSLVLASSWSSLLTWLLAWSWTCPITMSLPGNPLDCGRPWGVFPDLPCLAGVLGDCTQVSEVTACSCFVVTP